MILGTGTIVTTKLISEYLNISDEIRIKHHPRIIFRFSKNNKIKTKNESKLKLFYKNKEFVIDLDLMQ